LISGPEHHTFPETGLLTFPYSQENYPMNKRKTHYRAMVSSDWSECLSPNGPFDPISFTYPELEPDLARIFRDYTGNVITLKHAVELILKLLPRPLTMDQMDAYLDANFRTYTNVPVFIEWCLIPKPFLTGKS
jgi:hypothetical protein